MVFRSSLGIASAPTCADGKGSPYEGGHRVPFFIRWPRGGLGGGKDVAGLTSHIDLAPTMMEFCGVESPSQVEFDGISLAPLLPRASPGR